MCITMASLVCVTGEYVIDVYYYVKPCVCYRRVCHLCDYYATLVCVTGEYVIDVYYYGKPIQGSPFRVSAYDWNRIVVKNLPNTGMVGRLCEFDSEYILYTVRSLWFFSIDQKPQN